MHISIKFCLDFFITSRSIHVVPIGFYYIFVSFRILVYFVSLRFVSHTLIIPTPPSSTLRFLVLWMCNNDKFDNLSSPIVALRHIFTRSIALNERISIKFCLDLFITSRSIHVVPIGFYYIFVSFRILVYFVSLRFVSHFSIKKSKQNFILICMYKKIYEPFFKTKI
jgi:hypothetical protein